MSVSEINGKSGPAAAGQASDRDWALRRLVTPKRLQALFAPRSIALVGASDTSGWSKLIVDSLDKVGFDGTWVVVHPRHQQAFGKATLPSLRALDSPVDLAYILAPQPAVETVLADAAAAGVRNAIVLAAGYGEAGRAGRKRQERLVGLAIAHDMTLLGPNGLGYVNAPAKVAPYGLGIVPPLKTGSVGVILQSGALASTVLDTLRGRNIGVSLLVSMGNEAIVRSADVMEYLIEDDSTKVIALFLEGIRSAERFAALAARALQAGKPVVALKAGSTPQGQLSAAAHTGAVAGDDAVVDAAFRQFGVIRVRSLEELAVTAGLLAEGPVLDTGRRMGVITASGGCNDIIADRASAAGIIVPRLTSRTIAQLRRDAVPDFGSAANPVDVTGFSLAHDSTADETEFTTALRLVRQDPRIDFVLFMGVFVPETKPEQGSAVVESQTAYLARLLEESATPVVAMSETFGSLGAYQRELLERHHIHLVGGMDLGIGAIGHALWWQERRRRQGSPAKAQARKRRVHVPAGLSGPWPELAGRRLLQSAGVPVIPATLVSAAGEAVAAAEAIGYPVVLKAQADGLLHKSDAGGVIVGLASPAAVADGFDTIRDRISRALPGARFDGVLVSPMRSGGLELLAGVTRDPVFGPTLAVGLGGVWVELLGDVGLRVLPVTRADVLQLLAGLRSAPLLDGYRGTEPVSRRRVADAVARLCGAATSLGPQLESIEVNPFWCRGEEVEALDVLVITADRESAGRGDRKEA